MIKRCTILPTGRRGFTLIELLIVIAIIGILASIILASLDSARKKGRDANRVAETKEMQKALTLYYDANNQTYPPVIDSTTMGAYLATIPADPSNQAAYSYVPYGTVSNTVACTGYHLGASLEVTGGVPIANDADIASIPTGMALCTAAGVTALADFDGTDVSGTPCTAGDAGIVCYDLIN